jgi:hypothetical protein
MQHTEMQKQVSGGKPKKLGGKKKIFGNFQILAMRLFGRMSGGRVKMTEYLSLCKASGRV